VRACVGFVGVFVDGGEVVVVVVVVVVLLVVVVVVMVVIVVVVVAVVVVVVAWCAFAQLSLLIIEGIDAWFWDVIIIYLPHRHHHTHTHTHTHTHKYTTAHIHSGPTLTSLSCVAHVRYQRWEVLHLGLLTARARYTSKKVL
jgi:hypothetical protein